ncbi:hypothetical protein VTK56DRAFT_1243 [Thermocarpiscus australiensis]
MATTVKDNAGRVTSRRTPIHDATIPSPDLRHLPPNQHKYPQGSCPSLDVLPGALENTNVQVSQGGKSSGAQVEVARVAGHAAVGDGDCHALAVGRGPDLPAAERVVVGVAVGRRGVEVGVAQCDDEVAVAVGPAAGAQARVVPGEAPGGGGDVGAAGIGHLRGGRRAGQAREGGRDGEDGGDDVGEHCG